MPGTVPGHPFGDAGTGRRAHYYSNGLARQQGFQDRPAWNSVNDKKVHITIVMTWAVIWAHGQQDYAF